MNTETKHSNQPRYLTVNEWCKTYSWPPVGGIRHLIFNAESNGFKKVIRRCGRRILINEQAFFQWLEEKNTPETYIRTDNGRTL